MWDTEGNPLFRSLAPSSLSISIISLIIPPLSISWSDSIFVRFKHCSLSRGTGSGQRFSADTRWGVTGAAAATLLREGDEEDFKRCSELLDDPDEKIRIQAAMILAIVGSDVVCGEGFTRGLSPCRSRDESPYFRGSCSRRRPWIDPFSHRYFKRAFSGLARCRRFCFNPVPVSLRGLMKGHERIKMFKSTLQKKRSTVGYLRFSSA